MRTFKIWLSVLACLLLAQGVFADQYSFYVQDYVMDMEVAENGVYGVQEDILMNYLTPHHGFYRDIPVGYGLRHAIVEDVSVSEKYSLERDGNYLSVKIGNENKSVIGLQEYQISYTYDVGDDGYADYDEFYYNLVGEGWEVPIERFSFTVTFPKPIDTPYVNLTRGAWKSTTAENATWTVSADKRQVTGTVSNLMPGEAVTLRVQLSPGYFVGMREIRNNSVPAAIACIVLTLLSMIGAWLVWNRVGRDKPPVVYARYEAPQGLTPMDVGYLADMTVDNKDITSMIFYWADKGWLSISEGDKQTDTVFTMVAKPTGMTDHEEELFNHFFGCGSDGVVTLKELEKSFGKHVEEAKSAERAYFTQERELDAPNSVGRSIGVGALAVVPVISYAIAMTINFIEGGTLFLLAAGVCWMVICGLFSWAFVRKMYIRSRGKNIGMGIVALVILLVEMLLMLGLGIVFQEEVNSALVIICSLLMVLSVAAIMFLSIITRKRSDYAQQKLEEILGLREFIEKVEIDKLKLLIDSDPMFYYHVLCYAIVLGLEDRWANKFQSITVPPPSWYYGTTMWDIMFYSSLMRRWNTSFVTSVANIQGPRNPGSHIGGSSFGSGGFSGGGFGGGGGRGW